MKTILKPIEVRNALFFIGNFLQSGISIADALAEMAQIQPKHAEFWNAATRSAQNGFPLSHCLQEILSPATLSAFTAAEISGSLDSVLALIEQTYLTQEIVTKALKTLIKPSVMAVVGVAMFIFFSVVVIPPLTKTLPTVGHDPLMQFTSMLNDLYVRYGDILGIGLVVTVIGIIIWFRIPENQQTAIGIVGSAPFIGPALTSLHFGLWAYHMATSAKAGIVVTDALRLTYRILPRYLQPTILKIADDTVQHGLIGASDPSKRSADDPRQLLPRFIITAFRMAERTGDADRAFLSAGNGLVKQSVRQILIFSEAANNIILPIAAALIGSSILPYFTQIGNALDNLH